MFIILLYSYQAQTHITKKLYALVRRGFGFFQNHKLVMDLKK